MKTLTKLCRCTLLFMFLYQEAYSQSTTVGPGPLGHTAGPVLVNYCGWGNFPGNNAFPFDIEHRGTNNINFLTGGTQRMTILGTAAGTTQGYVGIGTAAPIFPLTVFGDGGNNLQFDSLTS